MTDQLSTRQKWQLVFRLLLLYSPLLLYVNMPPSAWSTENVAIILPVFIGMSVIAAGMYYVWITLTDWVQERLFRRFGQEFLFEFNWLAIILPILISFELAVLYAFTFQIIIKGLTALIFTVLHNAPPQPGKYLPAEVTSFIQRANNGFSVTIMLSAFYLTLTTRSYQQLKDVKLRAERLEKEAAMSQFEALKNQLSPHFLFNSLSILTSLVHEDADLSEQFVKQLSKAYRYILEQRDQSLVPLATELDFIQAYTFLLQIRFENKFNVVIDVSPDSKNTYQIAPLSLQLLIENAVKHNRMSVREPLCVYIHQEDEYLVIENPMQARDQPEVSTGVGLRNITNRYSLLTDRPVSVGEVDGKFVVRIPLLKSDI
jgi:sensor histidine kinase YesM